MYTLGEPIERAERVFGGREAIAFVTSDTTVRYSYA